MLFWLSFCSTVFATDTTAPTNPTTTSPYTHDLDDGTIGQPFGNCPAGTSAAYVYGSGSTIRWGECQNTFAISYAINQALQGTGVSIDKVHYQWKYIHCFNTPGNFCSANISNRANTTTGEVTDDTYWDELVVVVEVTDSSGNVVETKTWTMDTWYQWNSSNSHSTNEVAEGTTIWQIHEDNIEIYNHIDKVGTIRTPNSVGDVRFRINGYDKGNWDGYYGPIVKDIKTWFTYRANPCNDTALYDPSCPGYATAYAAQQYDQNCAANALYDTGCPGYATAYFNQQCSLDATHDAACPGYAEAIYTQQCTADPLYDSGCDGYAAAYLAQQCDLSNHHHSSQCQYYNWAITYVTAGWGENKAGQGSDFIEIVQADNSDRWWALWYNESELDAGKWVAKCKTYDDGCEDAVISSITFNSGPNPYAFLYTKDKDGNTFVPNNGDKYKFMLETQLDTYCDTNTLYSQLCDGYQEAYDAYIFDNACTANPLYNSECPGYDAAYTTLQCESNPLYDSSCTGYAEAYLTFQCEQNPLYNESCTGYDAAYLTQQCDLDPLHSIQCTGYQDAYFNQQCQYNPQYDELCPGYVEPVVETDVEDIVDDGTGTGDSVVDNIIEAPEVTIPGNIPGVEIIEVPEIEVEIPDITPVEPEVIEVPVPDVTEQLELEIEMELEMEMEEMEADIELDIEISTQDTSDDTMEVEVETEESESESIEDIEVETENESTEESTEEETTEEESTEEESTEEESTEEESEEESTEEESEEESENEESEEESEEEVEEEKEEEKEEKSDKKEKKEEKKDEKSTDKKEETTSNKSTKKKMTKEEKRKAKLKKMKEIIKNKLKELADVMGKAVSLEQQQALQAQITALINYVPGFKAYGEYYIPGVEFYQYEEIYKDKKIPENQRGLRNGLANEILHEKMVDMQYEGME